MSVTLSIDKLRTESAQLGTTPYLLTQGDDGRPHAVAVTIAWQDERIVLRTGRRSTANVAARPLISLLWPPATVGGYSLIVDGEGAVEGSGDTQQITVSPTRGVLHRPGPAPALLAGSCGSDSVPLR